MKYHELCAMIAEVLQYFGGYYADTPYINAYVYHDKKVTIYGIKTADGNEYISLGVWLNYTSYIEKKIPRFTHPKTARDATLVFMHENDKSIMCRSGRWIPYVKELLEQRAKEMEYLHSVNGQEASDYKLFTNIATDRIPEITFD